MAVIINPGDVFLLPIPKISFKHAHIIVTSIDLNTGDCICVPVDTWRGKRTSDNTVVIQPGIHPFINKQSYINYYETKKINQRDIDL